MTNRSVVGALSLLLILVVGCGEFEGGGQTARYPTVDEIIRMDNTESQAEYLADGVVTPEERAAAHLAWVSCLEANGVEVVGYTLEPKGGDSIDLASGTSDGSHDGTVEYCRHEYYSAVGAVYALQHGPTEEEAAEHAARIAACMRGEGVRVPDGLTLFELLDLDQASANLCYGRVEQ